MVAPSCGVEFTHNLKSHPYLAAAMGEVLIKYRVMPDGVEVDLAKLESELKGAMPAFATLQSCDAVPFAFGMKALLTTIVVEDEEGNSDKLEEIVHGVEGVQGVELVEMGRL